MSSSRRAIAKYKEKNEALKRSASRSRALAKTAPRSTAMGTFGVGKVAATVAGAVKGYVEEDSSKPLVFDLVTGVLATGAGAVMLNTGTTGGAMVAGMGSTFLDIALYELSASTMRKNMGSQAE